MRKIGKLDECEKAKMESAFDRVENVGVRVAP